MLEVLWPIIFGLVICIAWAMKGSKTHGCVAVVLGVLFITMFLVMALITFF